MSVRIQLDNPHTFYTNLDHISGRIILSLPTDESISAILVKLEGESRTVLLRPPPSHLAHPPGAYGRRDQRQGVAMENHKILYKVAQVFPSSDLSAAGGGGVLGGAYTVRAGTHEYPFRFKIPFNNGCSDPQSQQMGPGSGFGGFGLAGLQQLQYKHVKRTLPPSLTGFPGEAEIRYYVKVTVQRPSIFKENRRNAAGFKFLPIEPPRAPKSSNEVFARRPFVFQAPFVGGKKGGLFSKKRVELSDMPPKGEVDARLPSPPVLTCNEALPLRLIVRRTSDSPESVFLQSLQVHLIGSTDVRAQDVVRTETSTWVLMSLTGLGLQIGKAGDAKGTEAVVDSSLWSGIPLPNTVAPSFTTCNLGRRYELEVRVGLGYGVVGDIQPQSITLPLRFQVDIFSGISPPAALLSAMASRPSNTNPTANPNPAQPPRPPNEANALYPPQLTNNANIAEVDDAPPSYEDAIADELNIVPADGPRREYSGVTDENAPGMDEKGGTGGAAPSYSARQGDGAGRGGGG